MIRRYLHIVLFAFLGSLITSCKPWVEYSGKGKWVKPIVRSEVFRQGNTGFVLYDLEGKKWLADYQGGKRFTPASNTKLLTVLAALEVFGEELPVVKYIEKKDSLILLPTAFPGFGYINDLGNQSLDALIENVDKPVKLVLPENELTPYGPGWAWDDGGYSFQVPISILPLFGNRLQVDSGQPNQYLANGKPIDAPDFSHPKNQFIRNLSAFSKNTLPFFPDKKYIAKYLSEADSITIAHNELSAKDSTQLKQLSIPALPFYQEILVASDNFLAEQLLIMVSRERLNNWEPGKFTKQYFADRFSSDELAWADGSGLSRYNAISPRVLTKVIRNLVEKTGLEMTRELLPESNTEGTLKNYYGSIPAGHLFAKTGTLRHVHCLSGLIITEKGKTLIFSFMHNQIPGSNGKWKEEMEKMLFRVYKKH